MQVWSNLFFQVLIIHCAFVSEKQTSGKGRIRLSTVQSSDSGLSSAVIARKNQKNNPVRAMLNRIHTARVESQTKDIEDQLRYHPYIA